MLFRLKLFFSLRKKKHSEVFKKVSWCGISLQSRGDSQRLPTENDCDNTTIEVQQNTIFTKSSKLINIKINQPGNFIFFIYGRNDYLSLVSL